MTASSPADLAVTYRGLPRRLAAALDDCEDASAWLGHERVGSVLVESAGLLGVEADPETIAEVISARRAADWNQADLDRLRSLALQLGALVREAEAWRDESPQD